MMLMDYTSSQYTGSTLGSDTLSGAGSTSSTSRPSNRIRTVRLVRPNVGSGSSSGTGHIPLLGSRSCSSLGFGVRGGREHGTGFFVGLVERGSEADRQGLRVGDQIVRINGFTIEDAVHKEVLQLISNHTHLTLKVRSVGIIPVKDRKTDPLSWQIISSDCNSSTRSSPQLGEKNHDVRISIMVAPRSKLGCGICKGPEWKPGIFIQFTKEGGISREAGLRPGDQILYCNGIDFGDIAFNEAVSIMKTSRQLDLIIRKAAGSELFPGESSGYNSSASSVTGDQSPSWSESKRLSIVKEENLDLEDRLINHLDHHRFKARNTKWEKIEWDDMESDSIPENGRTGIFQYKPTIINLSANGTTIKHNGSIEECQELEIEDLEKNSDRHMHNRYPPYLPTSHTHTSHHDFDTPTLRPTPITKQQQQHHQSQVTPIAPEMRTVIVDVHRSELEDSSRCYPQTNQIPQQGLNQMQPQGLNQIQPQGLHQMHQQGLNNQIQAGLNQFQVQKQLLTQQDSVSSYGSVTSRSSVASATTSLSSAISQEIIRRSEKSKCDDKPSIDEQIQMKKILKGVDSDKLQQHSKLMDEFRQAHRKMFKATSVNGQAQSVENDSTNNDRNNSINRDLNQKVSERLTAPVTLIRDEVQDKLAAIPAASKVAGNNHMPVLRTNGNNGNNTVVTKTGDGTSGISAVTTTTAVHAPPPPPFPIRDFRPTPPPTAPSSNPPPPPHITNGFHNNNNSNNNNNNTIRSKTKAPPPPVPIKTSVLSHLLPPPCPTPDYDTLSLSSNQASLARNGNKPSQKPTNDASVEMESLDSFKLNRPYDATPRPPSTYFQQRKQNATNGLANGHVANGDKKPRPVSVTIGEYPSGTTRKAPGKLEFLQREEVDGKKNGNTQFASELAMTLSRSNLRKRTESMANGN